MWMLLLLYSRSLAPTNSCRGYGSRQTCILRETQIHKLKEGKKLIEVQKKNRVFKLWCQEWHLSESSRQNFSE